MAVKITEKTTEPSKVYTGSFFKLKIRISKQKYKLSKIIKL